MFLNILNVLDGVLRVGCPIILGFLLSDYLQKR